MKTNILNCPVNDYDFYTIPIPVKALLHRKKNLYISSQLEKLHPCFSDECSFDSHLNFGKKGLNADVVVMQKYKVAEYKAMHKRLTVRERKHIQFFEDNKKIKILGFFVAVVFLLVGFSGIVFRNRLQAAENPDFDHETVLAQPLPDSQKLFAPELLLQIVKLKGTVSDFTWNYDGFNESSSVFVKGIYPEQLEEFSSILKFSSVSFENFCPGFSTSFSNKVLQNTNFEKQNLTDIKNDLRQILLQNDILILEEVVKPFGIKFMVPQNQTKSLIAILEYLKTHDICITTIKINSTGDYLKIEFVFSEAIYKTPEDLYECIINNIEVFLIEQKPEEFKSAKSGDSAAQKSEGQLVKVGQIIKPDGSVVTYYKNENGKIMKR